ncbi:MAG: hypothetical protein ABEK59_05020 [Halobacteria archaeon]
MAEAETKEKVEEEKEEIKGRVDEAREDVEERLDGAVDSVNSNIDTVLSEVLETRARVSVYVGLRKIDDATVDELAKETGLYPEKIEKTLAGLKNDDIVDEKGDKFSAISPTQLVRKVPNKVGDYIENVIGSTEEEVEETTSIEVE